MIYRVRGEENLSGHGVDLSGHEALLSGQNGVLSGQKGGVREFRSAGVLGEVGREPEGSREGARRNTEVDRDLIEK